jgi:iron complex outermembrane receptor protein
VYNLNDKTNFFGDMQYRKVSYNFRGFDTLFNAAQQQVDLNFFNPKAGFNYILNDAHSFYISLSVGNKEPSRDDYVDSSPSSRPKPENMQDLEAGYRFQKENLTCALNYYYMNYKDQLVLTGQVNDVGNYTRTNIDKSYRQGAEMDMQWMLLKKITVAANATISMNKIKEYNQYLDDYDSATGEQVLRTYNNTDIAFSPNIIAAADIGYEVVKNLKLNFTSKYVGQQYLDNTSDNSKKIDEYVINDLCAGYLVKTKVIKEVRFGVIINNIFNHLYESNGYTYSYVYGGVETVENFYYPQAGINVLGQVNLKF